MQTDTDIEISLKKIHTSLVLEIGSLQNFHTSLVVVVGFKADFGLHCVVPSA
jgi:hypothetical protein